MTRKPTARLILLGFALAGCGPPPKPGPPAPVAEVDAIELSIPSTIAENWDDNPGPDGVWAMVRCYKLTPKTTAVTVSGTLEFLLFEGRVEPADLAKTKPFRVWTYRPDELPDYLYRHLLYGYRMQLAWVDRVPRTDVVTLTARYIPPSGEPIYALPVSITMTAK